MMEFHPHAVAYLDILGFSNFVKAAEEDPIKLKQLDMGDPCPSPMVRHVAMIARCSISARAMPTWAQEILLA